MSDDRWSSLRELLALGFAVAMVPLGWAHAAGPYTIASTGTIDTATRGASGKRLVYDGSRWWAFYQKSTDTSRIYYAYSDDLSTWTESSVVLDSGRTYATEGGALSIAYDTATQVVVVAYHDATNTYENNERYLRGAINGTTVSWSLNTNAVADDPKNPLANYSQRLAIDSAGKVLYQCGFDSGSPTVYRSSSSLSPAFNDPIAQWSLLGTAEVLDDYMTNSFLAPLGAPNVLVVVDDAPSGVPAIAWKRFNGTTWSTFAYVWSGANVSRSNWGGVWVGNAAVYLLGVTNTSALSFSVFDGTTWSAKTAPTWPANGVKASSGLPLVSDGTNVWAFVIRGDASNSIAWNRYQVSSGTWSGWTDLPIGAATRNYLQTAANVGAGKVAVTWAEGTGPYNMRVATAGASKLFFAVGQSTASDLRTGVPVTCSVSGNTLTFDKPQTDPRFGVGCKVTYGGNVCYVTGKTSSQVWSCGSATAGAPTAAAAGTPVTAIGHVFGSLSAAVTTTAGGGGARDLIGTSDLVTGGYALNFPCYYDTGPDSTPVLIDGYATGPSNYLRVYTPTDTATECNQSQRHDGKWNDARFRMAVPDYSSSITVYSSSVWLDGLQVEHPMANNYTRAVNMDYLDGEAWFSNNIVRAVVVYGDQLALSLNSYSNPGQACTYKVWNNVFYDFSAPGSIGIAFGGVGGGTAYVYNNTLVASDTGILHNNGTLVAKNNLVSGTGTNYSGTFSSSSTGNLSEDATAPAFGTYYRNKTVTFRNAGTRDFHLAASDAAARNHGVNLSADANLAFAVDADGDSRPASGWDIGADQVPVGAPAKLSFVVQPSSAIAGASISPAVQVAIQDASGNTVASSTAAVTLVLGPNPGGSTLSGTSTANAAAGIATFGGLSLDKAGSGYGLVASAPGFSGATSQAFDVVGAAAVKVVISSPARTVAAGACSAPVTVERRDAFDNPVATPGAAALASNSPTLAFFAGSDTACSGPPLSAMTLAPSAAFHFRDTQSGTPAVTASAAGLAPDTQDETVTPAAEAKLAFLAQPLGGTAGAPQNPPVQVQVRDSFDNPVSASTASVTLALGSNPGPGTLSGGAALMAVAGVASFPALSIDRAGVGYTLVASAGSLAGATSLPFAVAAGPAAKVVFTSGPQSLAAGACSSLTSLEARDALDNPVSPIPGVVAALFATPAIVTFHDATDSACTGTPLTTLLLAPGASFRFVGSTAGDAVVTASSGGLAPASQTETFTSAGPVALAFATAAQVVGAGACSSPVAVVAQDASSVPAPVSAATDLALASGSPDTLFFSDAACAVAVTAVTVAAGNTSTVFYFRDTAAGSATLTVAAVGLAGASQAETVLAGPAAAVAVLNFPSPTRAGEQHSFDVAVTDAFGNAAAGYAGTLAFSSTDATALVPAPRAFAPSDQGQQTLQATFLSPGTHQLVATDTSVPTLSGMQAGIVVTPNSAPLVVRDANLRGALGRPYAYNAAGAVRATGDSPISFASCAGQADFRVDADSGAVRWTPASAGVVNLCVKAKNASGEDSYAFEVDVATNAPAGLAASFSAAPDEGPALLTVGFDGSASSASPGALPLYFRWAFGDGSSPATGVLATRGYFLPGGYRARLAVLDAFGTRAEADAKVAVLGTRGGHPPSARIVASGLRGADTLTVDLSCDCAEGSLPLASYQWDLGDGTTASLPTAQVTLVPGRYHFSLTVVDAAGLPARDKVEVVVTQGTREPPECTAAANPPAGLAPLSTTWTAFAASAAGSVAARQWQFTPGGAQGGARIAETYGTPGRILGRLEVADETGLKCTDTVEVVVTVPEGVPPRIATLPAHTAQCGVPYLVSATRAVTAVGDGPFQWTAGPAPNGLAIDASDGTVAWIPAPAQRGPQEVTLKVQTAAGSDEKSFTVQVECGQDVWFDTQCGCGSGPGSATLAGALLAAFRHRRRRKGVRA